MTTFNRKKIYLLVVSRGINQLPEHKKKKQEISVTVLMVLFLRVRIYGNVPVNPAKHAGLFYDFDRNICKIIIMAHICSSFEAKATLIQVLFFFLYLNKCRF